VFGDYLYVQGIENEIEREANGTYAVWIADEDAIAKAAEILERFKQNPADPEYHRVSRSADEKRAAVAKDNAAAQKRIIKARQLFPGMGTFGVGPFTFTLVVACIIVAGRSKLGTGIDDLRPIFSLFITDPEYHSRTFLPEVRSGEVWRLFTPMLIHFGFVHILLNMMGLFQLGSLIESRTGTSHFIAMVLAISGGSNLVQILWDHNPYFGGMSGVVFGLFGYVWIRGKFDSSLGRFLAPQSITMMLVWLFACTTGLAGPIANGAHFGGLIIGGAWGFLAALLSRGRP